MIVKNLREFMFENCYKIIVFTKDGKKKNKKTKKTKNKNKDDIKVMLKPIAQLTIIIQKLEPVEKPKIFDIE